MNEVLERIFRTGHVEDAHGNRYRVGSSSATFEVGTLLYDLVRRLTPRHTLETGMAYGVSTLFICQALRDNGGMGRHFAIDPFQEQAFHSVGLANIERAQLGDLVRLYLAPSDTVLPQLCAEGERVDFAFIDGNHRFDYVLVDFFYINKLLPVGGYVAFDDLWLPAVRKAASFVLHNMPYTLVRPHTRSNPSPWTRVLRTGRRIVQNPVGRDWALKLVPHNVAVFEKVGSDFRGWRDLNPF